MISTPLADNWKFRLHDEDPGYHRPQTQEMGWMPASVPGYVHTDLMRNGVIGDPHRERFELGCRWVDDRDWIYECEFDWSAKQGLDKRVIVFEGLDTVADIYLNGDLVGSFDNMFLRHEIDVSHRLATGTNRLTIHFHSAVRVGKERRSEYFAANRIKNETAWFDERAFVRKAGCMYGWDWGPRLVSCGIWKPITLIEFARRVKSVAAGQTYLGAGRFRIDVDVAIEGGGEAEIFWNGGAVGQSFETDGARWEPNGEGEAVLHDLEVRLGDQLIRKKIGLRTIELRREPDEAGTSFEFVVNGRRVWCRGANWIPHDSFLTRISREDVFAAVDRYKRLGMNMLRVWGGGIYETDDFYDACDAAGIMVWQDFPYACSYYPDDEHYQRVALQEAQAQIQRLKDRASLAIWCGNNENRVLWCGKWGGAENAPERFYGEVIYDKVLKRACEEGDPGRPYIESSPLLVTGMVDEKHIPAQRHSDDHFWDVWHGRGDWIHYRDSETRFSSEFGFASSCSLHAWGLVSDDKLSPDHPVVRWHDKTTKPWDVFRGMVELHYPEARTLEDWVYYSQLNQRDAMRAAIEHYRSNPSCRGALIWQANDIWPVQSWSLEDHARLVKPAGFEMIRCFAPILLSANLSENCLHVTVCNDSQTRIDDDIVVRWLDKNGCVMAETCRFVTIEVGSRCDQCFTLVKEATFVEALVKSRPELTRHISLKEPKDLALQPQVLTGDVCGEKLILACPGYVFDLAVWTDGDSYQLVDYESGLAGCRLWTGRDLKVKLLSQGRANSFKARSLAGVHEIRFRSPSR